MGYSLIFTDSYEKVERRFLKRHPDLLDRYHKILVIMEQDPFHPSLRLHALEGRLSGLHARVGMPHPSDFGRYRDS